MKVGSVEVILVISLCYYLIVGMAFTTSYALYLKNLERIENEQNIYFTCEEGGLDINNPCDRNRLTELQQDGSLIVGIIFLLLYPYLHLVYVLNFKRLWNKCKFCYKSTKEKISSGSRSDASSSTTKSSVQ